MNSQLVRNHNAVVAPDDTVFHLGDFSMHPRELERLPLLNGHHHLIAGNHDKCHPVHKNFEKFRWVYMVAGFKSVMTQCNVTFDSGLRLLLHHMPYTGDHHDTEERYKEFRPQDEGRWLLHGHVHTTWKTKGRMINVGVDQWNYAPVSLEEIEKIIESARCGNALP